MKNITTVNVVEIADGNIISLLAWNDDAKGNKEAEKVFIRIIEEYYGGDVDGELIDQYLDDGIFRNDDGSYEVSILHSNKRN